jgi:hypothetical protein
VTPVGTLALLEHEMSNTSRSTGNTNGSPVHKGSRAVPGLSTRMPGGSRSCTSSFPHRSVTRVLSGKQAPLGRRMTLRFPQERHERLQAARVRQHTEELKHISHGRAGMEGTFSHATRHTGLRRSRSPGLKKTHLQPILSAVATTLLRFVQWRTGTPWANTRTSRFAAFAA